MQVLELSPKHYDTNQSHHFDEDKIDPAFRRIKPNSIGFHIWKLENDRIKSVLTADNDECGIFHDDDTYIIYAATAIDTPAAVHVSPKTVSREVKPTQPLRRYIHFWLGAATTAERSGAIAYKVIELDNHLGNVASQYRESQQHESTRFRSYFKEDGRIILSRSAEQLCNADDPVRLFEVMGKVSAVCVQRPVNWTSFCSARTMLLQTPRHIFVWLGHACTQTERRHGMRMAQRLQRLHAVPDVAIVDDGHEQAMAAEPKSDWNQYLSLAQRNVRPLASLSSNGAGGGAAATAMRLYRCGTIGAKYRIEELKTGGLLQTDLNDATAAFIVDCGSGRGVWIWLGRNCVRKDKAEAMRNARGFVKKKQYDSATPVVRVNDTHEPPEFRQLFPSWSMPTSISDASKMNGGNLLLTGKFDAETLAQRPRLAAQLQLIDDGAGALNVYKVHKGDLLQMGDVEIGGGLAFSSSARQLRALFSGDCFVLHYAVVTSTNNLQAQKHSSHFRHILYVWNGRQSTTETRHSAATLAAELYAHLTGGAMLVHVHEGQEPPHLLQAFDGRLTIFNGSADDYDTTGAGRQLPAAYLLQVSGAVTYRARAVQMLAKQAHITSGDCLVLATSAGAIWVWCGQRSTGDAREMAKRIGRAAAATAAAGYHSSVGNGRIAMVDNNADDGIEYVLAVEGSEPIEFWQCLPDQLEIKLRMAHGMTDVAASSVKAGEFSRIKSADEVGLYAVLNGTHDGGGDVQFEQIVGYAQSDLMPEDVFVLNNDSVVYVWLGERCPKNERKSAFDIAQRFISAFLPTRNKDTTIALVCQGAEPIIFIGYFDHWNTKHWIDHKSIDFERTHIDSTRLHSSAVATTMTNGAAANYRTDHTDAQTIEFNTFAKYPLDILRSSDAAALPEQVDPMRKEMHLTHDDFVSLFAMPLNEFNALPGWRKQELKKKHKLF